MICKNCGTENNEEMHICIECGQELSLRRKSWFKRHMIAILGVIAVIAILSCLMIPISYETYEKDNETQIPIIEQISVTVPIIEKASTYELKTYSQTPVSEITHTFNKFLCQIGVIECKDRRSTIQTVVNITKIIPISEYETGTYKEDTYDLEIEYYNGIKKETGIFYGIHEYKSVKDYEIQTGTDIQHTDQIIGYEPAVITIFSNETIKCSVYDIIISYIFD